MDNHVPSGVYSPVANPQCLPTGGSHKRRLDETENESEQASKRSKQAHASASETKDCTYAMKVSKFFSKVAPPATNGVKLRKVLEMRTEAGVMPEFDPIDAGTGAEERIQFWIEVINCFEISTGFSGHLPYFEVVPRQRAKNSIGRAPLYELTFLMEWLVLLADKFEARIAEQDREIGQLRKDLGDINAKLQMSEAALAKEQQDSLNESRKLKNDLAVEREMHQKELKFAKDALAAEVQKHQDEFAKIKENWETDLDTAVALARDQAAEDAQAEIKRIRANFGTGIEAERDNLRSKVAGLEKERDNLRKQLKAMDFKLLEKTEELRLETQEKQCIEDKLKRATDEVKCLDGKLKESEKCAKTLVDDKRETLARVQEQHKKEISEEVKLRLDRIAEIDALKARFRVAEKELGALLVTAMEEKRVLQEEADVTKTALEETVAKWETESEKDRDQIYALEKKLEKAEQELRDIKEPQNAAGLLDMINKIVVPTFEVSPSKPLPGDVVVVSPEEKEEDFWLGRVTAVNNKGDVKVNWFTEHGDKGYVEYDPATLKSNPSVGFVGEHFVKGVLNKVPSTEHIRAFQQTLREKFR